MKLVMHSLHLAKGVRTQRYKVMENGGGASNLGEAVLWSLMTDRLKWRAEHSSGVMRL